MNRYRWWHRLRGHIIVQLLPDFTIPNIVEFTRLRERCSCGDEWTFHAIGMYETYRPADPEFTHHQEEIP